MIVPADGREVMESGRRLCEESNSHEAKQPRMARHAIVGRMRGRCIARVIVPAYSLSPVGFYTP